MINASDIQSTSPVLIGSATGIDGTAVTTTDFTMVDGISMATHIPVFYIFKHRSGTLTPCQTIIKISGTTIYPVGLIQNIQAGVDGYGTGQGTGVSVINIANSGNLQITVSVASTVASTFDVFAYGVKRL